MSLRCPNSPHKTPSSPDGKGWTFTEPLTGVVFRSHSLDALQRAVEGHRFAVAGKDIPIDLAFNWNLRWLDEVVRQNPSAPSIDNPMDPLFEPPHIAQGRALWGELHRKADEYTDPYQLRDWFSRWTDRIPSYNGCRCKENAVALLHEMPPDFSREGFKDWAIRFHDAINIRLGKPKWIPQSTEG